MIQVVKCPSCAAPLEIDGGNSERCRFCGSRIIVSSQNTFTPNSSGFDNLLNQAHKLKEIHYLAQNGNKIEAIKIYRETFGGDLRSAKDAVENLADGKPVAFTDFQAFSGNAMLGQINDLSEIQAELRRGNKINAIKIYREKFGVGLKEAKDAVEALERGETINLPPKTSVRINNQAVIKTAKIIGWTTGVFVLLGVLGALAGVGVAIYSVYKATQSNPIPVPTPISNAIPTKNQNQNQNQNEKPSYAAEILRFGGEGTGAGFFKDNRSIAVDGEGRIYSGDYLGGRVQIFDKDGKFISQLMIDEERALLDLAADRKGNIFISQKGKILKFETESGKLSAETSVAANLRYLTISLDGKIIATDERSIYVFDENLKQLAVWKDAAQQAGLKFGISHLAVNGLGEIYALGKDGKDVCKFSREGKFIDRFKTKSNRGEDIAVDGKNRIVVSDLGEIYVYGADGNFIDSFKAAQSFGIVFNDAGELLTASRPFIVKYKLKD